MIPLKKGQFTTDRRCGQAVHINRAQYGQAVPINGEDLLFGLRKFHFTRQKANLFQVKFKISVLSVPLW